MYSKYSRIIAFILKNRPEHPCKECNRRYFKELEKIKRGNENNATHDLKNLRRKNEQLEIILEQKIREMGGENTK